MMRIRPAIKKDIPQILRIAKQVYRMIAKNRLKYFGNLGECSKTADFYQKAMNSKNGIVFVAEKGKDRVVGYVYASIERLPDDLIAIPHISVDELVVDEKNRRSKIGSALIAKISEWAKEKGLNVLQLAVWEFNKSAIAFYKKMGYKTIMRKMEKVLR